jgi:hypothetical protein
LSWRSWSSWSHKRQLSVGWGILSIWHGGTMELKFENEIQ